MSLLRFDATTPRRPSATPSQDNRALLVGLINDLQTLAIQRPAALWVVAQIARGLVRALHKERALP